MHWRRQFVSYEWLVCDHCRKPMTAGEACATLAACDNDGPPAPYEVKQIIHIECMGSDELPMLFTPTKRGPDHHAGRTPDQPPAG